MICHDTLGTNTERPKKGGRGESCSFSAVCTVAVRDCFDEAGPCDADTRPNPRQTELGEREAEDDVVVPDGRRRHVNDRGERRACMQKTGPFSRSNLSLCLSRACLGKMIWVLNGTMAPKKGGCFCTVGVVDEQRHAVLLGEHVQLLHLGVREDVAGGVCRAGDAHHADLGPVHLRLKPLEIDRVPAGGRSPPPNSNTALSVSASALPGQRQRAEDRETDTGTRWLSEAAKGQITSGLAS
jgi:hypothetical protein